MTDFIGGIPRIRTGGKPPLSFTPSPSTGSSFKADKAVALERKYLAASRLCAEAARHKPHAWQAGIFKTDQRFCRFSAPLWIFFEYALSLVKSEVAAKAAAYAVACAANVRIARRSFF
ncbi:MAG TPA: hypothetical protein IAC28_08220 [Candidatus Aphodovivens excrementavium]|nr:hypothetical protein [Candidatus Aphodovivens excrementavium]